MQKHSQPDLDRPVFPEYVLGSSNADGAAPEASIGDEGTSLKVSVVVDSGALLRESISLLSQCASSCILSKIVDLGCAYSDYACFCEKLHTISEPRDVIHFRKLQDMNTCMDGCKSHDQWHSPSLLLDICEAVDVKVVLPRFMRDILRIHPRQAFSSGFRASSARPTITLTSILTEIPDVFTTTILSTETPSPTRSTSSSLFIPGADRTNFASSFPTFTPDSTKLLTSSTSASNTSSKTGAEDPNNTSGGGAGMPIEAKIGIGVAIPLVFILAALAVWWLLVRRKKKRAMEVGLDDGGTTGIAELEHNVVAGSEYKHKTEGDVQELSSGKDKIAVDAIGNTYEMPNNKVDGGNLDSVTAHELKNNEQFQPSVMYSSNNMPNYGQLAERQEHELDGVHNHSGEFPDAPQARSPQIGRKPISTNSILPIYPPPWEYGHETEYMATTPAETTSLTTPTVASREVGSTTGDIDFASVEEEMTRIKAQKERLSAIQALDEREEQLRKILEAKK